MSTCYLTRHHKPVCHYPVPGGFRACTPWELVDGAYKRGWLNPQTGRTRTAFVERSQGGWRWRVLERSVRGIVMPLALGSTIKPLPRMCFGAAELAAETK